MSNFSSWKLAKLNKRFGLKRKSIAPIELLWQNKEQTLSEHDKYFLVKLQSILEDNIYYWNEQELIQNFIGPVFAWVGFNSENTNIFNERSFQAIVDGEELKGEPDAIIASGHDEPEKPFFCFHEYKKEIDSDGDPAGQCLSAMLAAQEINEHKYPVYGIYVVGQNWYFLTLKGKEYTISPSLSAVSNEIYEIYQRLLWLRDTIFSWALPEMEDDVRL
jgi:hypothetical protein